MARTDNDTWDLASSVGATATMVAAQRALANREGLIDDPFAEPLVRAVGLDFFIRALDGEIELEDVDPEFNMRRAAEGMAVRTRWFDKLFTDAAGRGCSPGGDPGRRPGRHGRTGCRGPTARPCTSSTSPRSSSSRAKTLRGSGRTADGRPAHRSRSICATTGRKRCWTTGSIPPSPPRGSPRAC